MVDNMSKYVNVISFIEKRRGCAEGCFQMIGRV